MFNEIFQREDVKLLLKKSLKDTKYLNKDCPLKINGETIPNDYYGLYFVTDALIKYGIIVHDEEYLEDFVLKLKRLTKKVTMHNDLIFGLNKILGQTVAKKLNIKDMDLIQSKVEILEYIYDKYIVNGYCYHAIPNVYKDKIKSEGIKIGDYTYQKDLYREVLEIFKKHNMDVLKDYLENMTYITIVDSAFMATYYAYNSPVYFSNFLTNNKYLTSKKVDKDAYIRKDYEACKNNLKVIINDNLIGKEKETVEEYFNKEWSTLQSDYVSICIIKRQVFGKDYLKDFNDILESLSDKDLTNCIMKVTEPRLIKEKCQNDIASSDINIIDLPGITEIIGEYPTEEMTVVEEKAEVEEPQIIPLESSKSAGIANYLVLIGTILITSGVIMTIVTLGG